MKSGFAGFALIFRVLGGILLGVGVVQMISTAVFLRNAERAAGEVIRLESVRNAAPLMDSVEGSGVFFYPVIRFETRASDLREFRSRWGRPNPELNEGSEVTVVYNPADPEQAHLDSWFAVWGASIVWNGLALIFLLFGFLAPQGYGASRSGSGESRKDPETD
jgi:hypothetical protein